MIRQLAGKVGRRLKRSRRCGRLVGRAEELAKDCSLALNGGRRRRLLSEWTTCASPSEILEFSSRHFNPGQRPREILAFAEFARARSPQVFCEIGMFRGGTHLFLTHALPSVTTTIAIDPLVQNKASLRLLAKPGQRSFFINSSSQSRAALDRLTGILRGAPIDILLIDGDHAYESVRHDFLTYRSLVREGGLIAFHDICDDYFTRFGRHTGHFAGGVPRLWRQLRSSYQHHEFVDSPDQDGFGLGVIVYRALGLPPRDLQASLVKIDR